jgi:hypothetical protein
MNTATILRLETERKIVTRVVTDLLAAGCALSVHDGEAFTVRRSRDPDAVLSGMFGADEDLLFVRDATGRKLGFVHFIYGNDGDDVIADYTVGLAPLLTGAEALAEQLAGSGR